MAYLLDTNVISEFLKKTPNEKVIRWFEETDERLQFISAFSVGEIQKGISRLTAARRRKELQDWFDGILVRYDTRIVPFTLTAARIWGTLLSNLESKGRVLPVIDSLIAATALERDLTIVTRNTSDFAHTKTRTLNIWD